MPTNKNAILRIQVLDELLSNRGHWYTWEELVSKVNEKIKDKGEETVTRRCIEKDINYIEDQLDGEIEKKRIAAESENCQMVMKTCIHYKDKAFSIFRKKMTEEELGLLKEVLRTLGQFDGLPDFSVIAGVIDGCMAKNMSEGDGERRIIAFDRNPNRDYGSSMDTFARLYLAISRKQAVKLKYHTFKDVNRREEITLHPCLLKEYNRRWFAFGITSADRSTLMPFPLDRIDEVEPMPASEYVEFDGTVDEWFEDIVGVTRIDGEPIHKIIFWINDEEKYYIMTKPLHESQKQIRNDSELRSKHPQLKGGSFFSIECRKNYELIRELCSFGGDLIVLEPQEIKEAVLEKIEGMTKAYSYHIEFDGPKFIGHKESSQE